MKNSQKLKPAKKTKNYFNTFVFLFSISISVITVILLEAILVYFRISNLKEDTIYLVYLVPLLLIILVTAIPIAFGNFFKNFAKIEQSLSKVADGDFSTRIPTEKSGAFEESFKNFNKMAEELEKNKLLNDNFAHSFSHEFKTPIASIKGFADLLLEENLTDEEKQKYLKIISTEAERLTHLSENALFISRLSNESIVKNKSVYDLGAQVKHAVAILDRDIANKGIEIVASIDNVKVYASYELMQEVWLNLIGNAVKFSKEYGKIYISVKNQDDFAIVSVKDYGIGISESDKEKIFSPYYQADTSHKSSGFGLGLSIVKKIIDLSDGEILVDSEINNYTEFTVKIPLMFLA